MTERVGEFITFYTRIREVLGSNIGLVTDYPAAFVDFSQSLNETSGFVPQLGQESFLRRSFQFVIHQSYNHLTLV
jgi:hypothetical protein